MGCRGGGGGRTRSDGDDSLDASLFSTPGRENFNEKVSQAASHGFVGCLSAVQFNHVAPLKAALMNRGSSLVTIRGPLVQSNCGALAESTSHTLQGRSTWWRPFVLLVSKMSWSIRKTARAVTVKFGPRELDPPGTLDPCL